MGNNNLRRWGIKALVAAGIVATIVSGGLTFSMLYMPLHTGSTSGSSVSHVNDSRSANQKTRSKRMRSRTTHVTNQEDADLAVPTSIPVLMYHCVNDKTKFKNAIERSLTIETKIFSEQLDWLLANGYHVVSLDNAYDAMTLGKKLPKKPVVLSFDDGAPDAYLNVYPMLKQRKMSGTFFVKVKEVENGQGLTWVKVAEMADAGMQIESHTMTHADLPVKTYDELVYELQASRSLIRDRLGQPAHFLAYPSGDYNNKVAQEVRKAGYFAAFTTRPGFWKPGDDPYTLKRVRVSRGESLRQFAFSISGGFDTTSTP